MKRLLIAFAAAVAFSTAPAAILDTQLFEDNFDSFVSDSPDDDESTLAEHSSTPSITAPYPCNGFGQKYLSLDTGGSTLWRDFDVSGNVYFDMAMQFKPNFDPPVMTEGAKLAVYMDAQSNLVVTAGVSPQDRTATNYVVTSKSLLPNTWARLTVSVVNTENGLVFNVFIDEDKLYSDGTSDFPCLTSGTTVTQVGFNGSGALDDFVARTTDPFYDGTVVATIGGEGGEKYDSLETAIADSFGGTVALAVDHSGEISVGKPGTYVVNANGHQFGGLAGTDEVYVYSSVDGDVTTYTVFSRKPTPIPVAVWNKDVSGKGLDTEQSGFSINLAGSKATIDASGSLVFSSEVMSYGGVLTIPSGTSKVSVLFKYSSLNSFSGKDDTYPPTLVAVRDDGKHEVGMYATNNATAFRFYRHDTIDYAISGSAVGPDMGGSSGYALFSYSVNDGIVFGCGSAISSMSDATVDYTFGGTPSITALSIGGSINGTLHDAWPGLKIEKVALFINEYLSASDIASFDFENYENIISVPVDTTVSAINAEAGAVREIWLNVADGVTITGDVKFDAATVHFASAGSFNIVPPAGNAAMFDFAGVAGQPRIKYSGALPTATGAYFTSTTIPEWIADDQAWTGTVWLNSTTVTDFTVNPYGNESSVVRLSGISGWVRAPGNYAFTNSVPVELDGTGLNLTNGNSANDAGPNRCTVFKKVSGSGSISANNTANKVVIVIQDGSEFTGNIGLNGKLIVFGDAMPSYADNNKFTGMEGSIWVMEGASVTARPASGNWWAVGGIKVAGELRASDLDKFGGGTYITTSDTGKFTLTNSGNVDDSATDYKRITGTGTLKLESNGNFYRALSTNNFPTTMVLENELQDKLLLKFPGVTHEIGSLSGTKGIRSDWSSGDRNLRIFQSKDTTYSGLFDLVNDRVGTVYVAPGATTAGTLTLSGTQTADNALEIAAGAKVKITGTWVGNVTVDGSLGGSGTVTGNVTFGDGSVLAVASAGDVLTVTGDLTATGAVRVDLPAGTDLKQRLQILSATGAIDVSGATFNIYIDGTYCGSGKVIVNGSKLIIVNRGFVFRLL